MKIAFYSPLKSPNHPVPSGDRLMARLIIRALSLLGHDVAVVSELRTFMRSPHMDDLLESHRSAAQGEVQRIAFEWSRAGVPDLWFTYHPYYKAPDLLGPTLSARLGIPMVIAEASYSSRRNLGVWERAQALLLESLQRAAVTVCLTRRDRDGLAAACPKARLALLPPFIDSAPYLELEPAPESMRLVTVAMMRPGDKLSSYKALSESLSKISHLPWTLSIAGDGECRSEVEHLFSGFPNRIQWLGALQEREVAELLSHGYLFVWPGHGEAYGLAYLEAQAAGLPVVAERTAGVPEVVVHEQTGLLTPPGDREAFAEAIAHLLSDKALRSKLAGKARQFAGNERSLDRAAVMLGGILDRYVR